MAIFPLILLTPAARSVNTIGTSSTFAPARTARSVISTWNAYPSDTKGVLKTSLSIGAFHALKPPVRSLYGSPNHALA